MCDRQPVAPSGDDLGSAWGRCWANSFRPGRRAGSDALRRRRARLARAIRARRLLATARLLGGGRRPRCRATARRQRLRAEHGAALNLRPRQRGGRAQGTDDDDERRERRPITMSTSLSQVFDLHARGATSIGRTAEQQSKQHTSAVIYTTT